MSANAGPYFPDTTSSTAGIRPPAGPPPPPASPPPPTTARAGYAVADPAYASGSGAAATTAQYRDVVSLLNGLGLPQYIPAFEDNDFLDLDLLLQSWTTERDFKELLREIGVTKLGHREMIAQAVKNQRG